MAAEPDAGGPRRRSWPRVVAMVAGGLAVAGILVWLFASRVAGMFGAVTDLEADGTPA